MAENTATPSCVECGAPLVREPGKCRRPAKRCSDACRTIAARRRAAEWYQSHRDDPAWTDRVRATRKRAYTKWRSKNADYVRRKLAEWREQNRDVVSEQYRRWRIENAEKVNEKNRRRRARLADAFVADVDMDEIWRRDAGRCRLCGDPIDRLLPWPDPFCLTLDHIVPLARGGTHEPANVQIAHAVCNCIKGDREAVQS